MQPLVTTQIFAKVQPNDGVLGHRADADRFSRLECPGGAHIDIGLKFTAPQGLVRSICNAELMATMRWFSTTKNGPLV